MSDASKKRESTFRQTLLLSVANVTQKILDLVFSLAQMTLCVMTLRNFPPFVGPNVISDVPQTGTSISG